MEPDDPETEGDMTRDLLTALAVLAAVIVWAVVVVTTVVRGHEVPAELWAVPGLLIGSILAAFKSAGYIGRRRPSDDDTAEDPRP